MFMSFTWGKPDRCENEKLSTSLAHCVPFPAPGPPNTNMTVILSLSNAGILVYHEKTLEVRLGLSSKSYKDRKITRLRFDVCSR